MAKPEKIMGKWRKAKGSKQPVKLTEVENVLYGLFGDYLIDDKTSGSHTYKLQSPLFVQIPGSIEGIFTVVVSGNKVKRNYVDRLLKAYDIIEENKK